MKKAHKTWFQKTGIMIALALMTAVLMTLLSAVPPLSFFYEWTLQSHRGFLWNGAMAGVIALVLIIYYTKNKNP